MPQLFRKTLVVAVALSLMVSPLPALTAAKSQVNELRGVNQSIEQIEFRDISVGDALRILSEQSNMNIIASNQAANLHITMFLRRVTAMEVLNAISKTYNLWYQIDKESNIVRLYTVKEYRMEQVEFKKEETEIFTLKNAKNALDLAETIQNLFSTRVKLSYGRNQQELMTDLQQRFARFDMVDKRTKQQFDFSSGTSGGGNNQNNNNQQGSQNNTQNNTQNGQQNNTQNTTSPQQSEQNNTSGTHNSVDERLNALNTVIDKLQSQKNGENGIANTLTGDANDSRDFVDSSLRQQAPIFVGVIKHQNRVLVRTRDVDAMNEIRKIYKRLDLESSMVLMEVKILSIDLSDGYNSLFDFNIKNGETNTATGAAINSPVGALSTAASSFSPALLATTISKNFEARLQLLEKENRVTELATPMLMTSNQEVSRFLVGSTIPILMGFESSKVVTSGSGNNNSTIILPPSPIYEQRTVGNTLLLTPNINADNTVNIQVLVEQSSVLKDGATILVPPATTNGTVETQAIDTVQEKTFSGSVIASNNTAVAVGGLIQESATNAENKVPVLGDIPALGFFFRDEGQNRKRSELVIIIKPHIINSPLEAQKVSQNVLHKNSVHPNADDAESLDVYSNPDRQHKGYVLEKPFKEYAAQDDFDNYRGRGDSREFPENSKPDTRLPVQDSPEQMAQTAPAKPRPHITDAARQSYIELTRYAAKAVRVPAEQREKDPSIISTPLSIQHPVDLIYTPNVRTVPIAAWRRGGVNVTVLEVRNLNDYPVQVDYTHLKGKGQWLASTIEQANLGKRDTMSDLSYLYLISAESFDEVWQ